MSTMAQGRIALAGIRHAGLKEEKEHNTERGLRLVREAAGQGAQVVLTPAVGRAGEAGGLP